MAASVFPEWTALELLELVVALELLLQVGQVGHVAHAVHVHAAHPTHRVHAHTTDPGLEELQGYSRTVGIIAIATKDRQWRWVAFIL